MPLQETKFSGHRVQLRRSSRLQRCNCFSNTADDPIDLEPTKESEINNNMEDDQQNSTPTTSEGSRKKRYKHAAKKNKVKPGQKSTPDSDESNEEPYSIHELYRAEFQAKQQTEDAQQTEDHNQSEQTEDTQQTEDQTEGNFEPPTEEDQNMDEENQQEDQNMDEEHAEENQQSQSQEEAQNKDKSPTAKNKKWKRKKTEEEEAQRKAKRPNFHLPTKKDANEKYELFYADRVRHKGIKLVERQCPSFKGWTQEKLRERQAIDVYGGPFGFGLIMKPLRDLPSSQEQTATENAKGNDKGKDVPNPASDDWNDHQNDDNVWEELERVQRQSVQNETIDREDVRDTEQHIQVEQQHGDGQASSEKDFVESIRSMADDLIDTKLLFDTELTLALQKYPTNEQLLDIKNIVFNVFHQQGTEKTTNTAPPEQTTKTLPPEKTTNTRPTYSRPSEQCTDSSPPEENTDTEEFQDCYEEEDFQLTIEDVEQLDLLSFVDSAKINAQQTDLFETDTTLPPEKTTNTRPTYSRPSEQCTDSSPPEENTDTEEFQDCYEEEDFQLTIEDVEQLDLLSFVDSAKINAQQTELFETDTNATLDEKKTLATTYKLFAENVDSMLNQCNRTKLDLIDMAFFPICAFEHYYLIVYHLKNWSYEIIDNIDRSKIDPKKCYGEKPKILDGQDHQLIKLRIKYNNAILSSQLNQKRKEILKQGKELYIEAASKKLVDLVINSSQQSQEERQTSTIVAKSQNKKKVTFAKNLITPFNEVSDPQKDV
uniref:Uncharacterized protein n=1 Tax=Daucus carota subsp. sativus TaxID=79200 RepID=A0A175YEK6_DAUCS